MDDGRIDNVMGNALEAMEVLNQLDSAVAELDEYKRIFPLQTVQSLADRWGRSRQAIIMRVARDPHFPKPVEGIVEETKRGSKFFKMCDVEVYERIKGLAQSESIKEPLNKMIVKMECDLESIEESLE